jgi:hypothetical protein
MNAYKTYITIEDPKQVVLSDLPFQVGQRVEIIVLAEDNPPVTISNKLRNLFYDLRTVQINHHVHERYLVVSGFWG